MKKLRVLIIIVLVQDAKTVSNVPMIGKYVHKVIALTDALRWSALIVVSVNVTMNNLMEPVLLVVHHQDASNKHGNVKVGNVLTYVYTLNAQQIEDATSKQVIANLSPYLDLSSKSTSFY